ncbi:DUF6541 family protein [Pseudoclavibacter sp. CFCC 13611]|uniref:DUF6541 family protein n=1 Tax=Pseudoclavibacter sp. CFCC 13611 TaxID=2615178 RepID=UPI001301221E|nr:DUF6541 family protein [Pseudoclavibacter sp. CFCC 13611]KAB1663003.1 hypothetical protein F8O08_10695 [Pseudoclavibacter sp. CFCC 13611]
MTDWLQLLLGVGIAICALYLPGWLLLRAYGVRSAAGVALAPVASLALIVLVALGYGVFTVRWNLMSVIAGVTALLLVGVGIGWLLRRWLILPRWQWRSRVALPLTLGTLVRASVIPAVAMTAYMLYLVGSPTGFSQSYDNMFHLNAVRFILDTGASSPFRVMELIDQEHLGQFYPAAWHEVVSVVALASGSSIPIAANAVNLVIVALVWPMGVILLAQQLWPSQKHIALAAGVAAVAFLSFPLRFLYYGVLYPNLLGFSLIPAVTTLVVRLLLTQRCPISRESRFATLVLLGVSASSLAVAHPNALMYQLVIFGVVVSTRSLAWGSKTARGRGIGIWAMAFVTVVSVWLVIAVLWNIVRPPAAAAVWEPTQTVAQAFGEVALNAQMGAGIALAASVLMWVGGWQLVRGADLFAPLLFLMTAAAFVIVSGFREGGLRDFVGGVLYNDSYRAAALVVLPAVLLGAYGLSALCARVHVRLAIATIIIGCVALQSWALARPLQEAQKTYQVTADSSVLDSDEKAVLDQLDEVTPPDARIMVNPGTGAAFAYALADRQVTGAHVLFVESADEGILRESLSRADQNPQEKSEVCEAVATSGVDYVLDFGIRQVNNGGYRFPGIEDIPSDVAETVVQVGNARLLRIRICD